MSWRHVIAARQVGGLTAGQKAVLLVIATYTNARGKAWPSAETLAAEACMHPSSVRRILPSLPDAAGIGLVHRRGRTSEYDFSPLVDPAPSATPTPRPPRQNLSRSATQNSFTVNRGRAGRPKARPRDRQAPQGPPGGPTAARPYGNSDVRPARPEPVETVDEPDVTADEVAAARARLAAQRDALDDRPRRRAALPPGPRHPNGAIP
jgi:hypothetical protein